MGDTYVTRRHCLVCPFETLWPEAAAGHAARVGWLGMGETHTMEAAPAVASDRPSPRETASNVSRETMPEWVRRAQGRRLVAKDMTRG